MQTILTLKKGQCFCYVKERNMLVSYLVPGLRKEQVLPLVHPQ